MIDKQWRPGEHPTPGVWFDDPGRIEIKPLRDEGEIPEWVDPALAAVTFLAAIVVILGVLLWPIITHPAVSN